MRKFDYSFLSNDLLPANLVNLIANIYELQTGAKIRKNKNENAFLKLKSFAKIQSIKCSNEIEGIITTDKRIYELVTQSSAPLNHNEEGIAGYRDALNLIHTNYENISFSEKNILLLHKTIMSFSDSKEGGKYKKEDNLIIKIDEFANRKVRYRPLTANKTKEAMKLLELGFLDAYSNPNINKLLLIPCLILDFLCIHPFSDGNGRISRLLSLLLLYKEGFDAGKYISFEQQINKYKDLYYDALKESSINWDKNKNDYFPFMMNFLSMLYMCYKELDNRFNVLSDKSPSKYERIERTILESLKPLSKKEISLIHPDISPTTIEAALSKMLKEKKIKKIGAARNTKYFKID